MKAIVNAAILAGVLKAAQSSALDNTGIEILGCVLLHGEAGSLTITATNLDRAAEIKVEAEIPEPGDTVINIKRALGIVAGMEGDVRIDADGVQAKITYRRSHFSLRAPAHADFPLLLAVDAGAATWEFQPAELARFRAIGSAAWKDEHRAYLAGVYVHGVGGLLHMAATDGAALVVEQAGIAYPGPGIIIPVAVVEIIGKLFGKTGTTLRTDGRKIEASSKDIRLTSKLVDGCYPDYARLIEPPPSACFTIETAEFAANLKRLEALAADRKLTPMVVASWDNDTPELRLTVHKSEKGEADVVIPAETRHAGCVGFSPSKMVDLLDVLDVKAVRIANDGEKLPLRFFSPEREGTTALLMHMYR